MDTFLHPGVRLMRHFAVAGKFVTIALVLLLPLSLLAGTSIQTTSEKLSLNARERHGLTLARPLVFLAADLFQWRIAAVTGRGRVDLMPATHTVDEAEAAVGQRLGVHPAWLQLRREVVALTSPGDAPSSTAVSLATQAAATLLNRVSSASGLVPDQQLDCYYLAITLTDQLPSLLDTAATAAESLASDHHPSAGEASVVEKQLITSAQQLTGNLETAVSSTRWSDLEKQLRPARNALQLALAGYAAALDAGPRALSTSTGSGRQLTSAVSTMIVTVADALTVLLSTRSEDLFRESAAPMITSLGALLVAAYLFAALARTTSWQARRVLADINALTSGTLHQSNPLHGRDEFAEMSRAVVVARDHLTALLGTLRYQATHDELTALANRALFSEKLTEALVDPAHSPGVVVIDLDGIEDVTDSFGHAIGDRLLRSLGARFHRAARRHDLVARLGPDQFGMLVLDAGHDGGAVPSLETLKTAMEQPVGVDGRLLRVQATVGIAISPEGGTTATELLRNADVAVHAARRNGTGNIAVFEPAMHEATRERTELSFDLVHAVEDNQLNVVYQPIVDLTTQEVHGVEALLRWDHPQYGLISPSVFVPLAEATGLIVPIGRWVMRQAVHQLAQWQAAAPDQHPLTMDINLSADQLGDEGLVGELLSLISETGVDPHSVVLEITESAVVQDLDTALRRFAQLSAMGVRLALDDFGTGYSSLSYLRLLPVSVLKIDKSFLAAADETHDARGSDDVLLRGIVSLGAGLGMQVVAEGVETPEQAHRLCDAGCHLGQGYLWSPPVEVTSLANLLTRRARRNGVSHPTEIPRPRSNESAELQPHALR
jgi:diguanylate cyclase (GGDEF)-like protein